MRPWRWSAAELVRGLRPWQRLVMFGCLCALMVPFWFAAQNVHRFTSGHRTKTEGTVYCAWDGPCRGSWLLPGRRQGSGEIEGLTFAADEEGLLDIPLFAGRDWAVTDRSGLLTRAIVEALCGAIGMVVVLWIAWARS
ncbi:hypothetical protein ACGFNQ_22920 [Streptomyces asoensis]|uniref:hypothetical protein n=1 Tax=Streptomyces asoensis TaxID=249586 RepID=UPI00371EA23B